MKRIVIISNKMVYTSCHTICRMTWPLKDWRGSVCLSLSYFSQEWILGKGHKSPLSQKFHWNCWSCSEDVKGFFFFFWIFWHFLATKKVMGSECSRWYQHFFTFNLLSVRCLIILQCYIDIRLVAVLGLRFRILQY